MSLFRRALPPILLIAAFAAILSILASQAFALEPGVVETPRTNVMQVTNGEVLDSVVVGNRIIVVGTFTQVQNTNGNDISQPYIAAYDADTGAFDGSFRPEVDNFINAIVSDGSAVYIVGQFGNVDGDSHRRIAKINANGSVNSQFTTSMGSTPNTLAVANGKVYVGGPFTTVNNEPREAFAAVNASTGDVDTATNFDFEDPQSGIGGLTVRWIDVSPNGNFLFMTHSAGTINGQLRTGVAKFDISANSTTLNNWQTLLYEDRTVDALRMRRIAVAPNNSYLVVTTSAGDTPPSGDTAVRFPTAGGANVQADWVSRHFDTVLGVAISDDTVFVGGHFQFQEAPGSTEPFPGDPDVNYGFGQNQGPQILGDEVVQREQLGALDPATGKSLDWNPGSDSFIGVQSLTWSNTYGLLVGHDGDRLGGVNDIGRHGIFPLGTATPPDPGGDDLACNADFDGNRATITFTGDLGTSLQARRNGNWAASVNGSSVTINANSGDVIEARVRGASYDGAEDFTCTTTGTPTTPGTGDLSCTALFAGNSATITFAGDLGDSLQARRNGSWAASVNASTVTINANSGDLIEARVRGASYDGAEDFTCAADGTPNPTGPSTTTITSPANGGVVDGGTVTISGVSEAPAGVSRVRLSVVLRATGQYVTPAGGLTAQWTAIDADFNGNNDEVNWSIDLELANAGDYDITARTFDSNGSRDETVRRSFVVGTLNNAPPDLVVDTPVVNDNGTTVTFSGTATDDLGVDEVEMLILNSDTTEYLRLDGTLGTAQRFTATLSNPGAQSTDWSLTVSGFLPAEWRAIVDAFDTTDQRDRVTRRFTIE